MKNKLCVLSVVSAICVESENTQIQQLPPSPDKLLLHGLDLHIELRLVTFSAVIKLVCYTNSYSPLRLCTKVNACVHTNFSTKYFSRIKTQRSNKKSRFNNYANIYKKAEKLVFPLNSVGLNTGRAWLSKSGHVQDSVVHYYSGMP